MEVDYLDGPKLFVVRDFLAPHECLELIECSERLGYADAPITTTGGFVMRKDIRDNQRVIVDDPDLAAQWCDRARGLLVEDWFGWGLVGLNERFRYYRYDVGQRFARHTD